METYPVVEELPGRRTGIWQQRLKAKHIYRELGSQRQVLKQEHEKQRRRFKISALTIPITCSSLFGPFLIFFLLMTGGEDPFQFYQLAQLIMLVPFPGMILFMASIITTTIFYGKTRQIKSKAQRFGVLGCLSQKLAGECSHVDLFIDFGDATKVTTPYRTARSPYSGALKQYYHFPWLRYDTNLLDGTKFLLSSHQKIKTKSNSVWRDILTFNFKFSFKVKDGELLPEKRLTELETMILEQIKPYIRTVHKKQQDHLTGWFILIDYPSDGVLRFILKIWGHNEHLVPSGLILMLGEFYSAIRTSYPDYTGFALQPLKRSVESPKTVTEQVHRSHSVVAVEEGLKPRQWKLTATPVKTSQFLVDTAIPEPTVVETPEEGGAVSTEEVIGVDLTSDEEHEFDNLGLYLGEPVTSISGDGEPYLKFEPEYDFTEIAVGVREKSFVWTAISSITLPEHLEMEISVDSSKDYHLWNTIYSTTSARLVQSPISSFTVGLKLSGLKDDLMRLSVHSNEQKQPIIFAETIRRNPAQIYRTFELIKSILRELRYPRFA